VRGTAEGNSRPQTHTALGVGPNHAKAPMGMQLEDDQTDNQTVYLNPNRRRADGAAPMNLSQMSSFGGNQNRHQALTSGAYRDEQGVLHASREGRY